MDFVQISIGEKQKEMLQCGFPLVKKQGNRLPKISCNQMVTGAFGFCTGRGPFRKASAGDFTGWQQKFAEFLYENLQKFC